MANDVANAALWAAVFTPSADEIAREIVQQEYEMRKMEEEAYWSAWDMEVKRKVIERLRNHEEGFYLMTFRKQRIYPEISQDETADLIEKGDIKIVAPTKDGNRGLSFVWTDKNREEARNPLYSQILVELPTTIG